MQDGDLQMLYGLARAELAVQEMPAAERHMREYLAKRDDDATAHFGLGRVLQISLTAEHLQDFADIAGIECLRIDAGTKVRDFVKELQWNDAYYHLAKGI